MKKGLLNLTGRKNQSLFDTKVKIQDMENVELVLDSTKISESGTANVRARPTVKHHTSVADSFQGFAVPTPKVPLLPNTNGPKINGTDAGTKLSNGSIISGHMEDEIFVPPPPPSMAPPPPPVNFIPPPVDFLGDLNTLDALQSPSMPAPKPPLSKEQEDLAILKPPSTVPLRPSSACSTSSASSTSISNPLPTIIPEHPKFAPPQPPQEKQPKTSKVPPPKPARYSSMFNIDSPPDNPAPSPTGNSSTFSTFNPQHKPKILDTPKTTFLGTQENHDARPKQMLLLEDLGSGNSVPVLVTVEGKPTPVSKPAKPDPKEVQEPQKDLEVPQPSKLETPKPSQPEVPKPSQPEVPRSSQLPQPELQKEIKKEPVASLPDITKPLQSPQLQKMNNVQSDLEVPEPNGSPGQTRSFSPMLDRKLRTLKANENSGTRETHTASPLALLQAAKQRDKQRTSASVSRESSTKMSEQSSAIIYPSDSSPNSFVVVPKSPSSYLTPSQERLQESTKSVWSTEHENAIQAPEKSFSPAEVIDQKPPNGPAPSFPIVNNLVEQKQNVKEPPSMSQAVQEDEDLNVPLLPPPPGFDDFLTTIEPPPSIHPPDPPPKKALQPAVASPPPTLALPNHIPPPPPKLPPPETDVKPKAQFQTKPKPAANKLPTNQVPATLSPNQATLLSILQKKMIEMDQKMTPVNNTDSSTDDWGTTASEEDNKVPVIPKAKSQIKNPPPTKTKPTSMDMKELEGKLVKKYQQSSQVKPPTSGGAHSRHQYGMTFNIRPGAEQPITLVSKGES